MENVKDDGTSTLTSPPPAPSPSASGSTADAPATGLVPSGNPFLQNELVRIIVQCLEDLGYKQARSVLEKESGVTLQSSMIDTFIKAVYDGNWPLVESLVPQLEAHSDEDLLEVKFLIWQQKYLELLQDNKTKEALECLRTQLCVATADSGKLHRLSALVMCTDTEDLKKKAGWEGKGLKSRHALLNQLRDHVSESQLLPSRRLEELLQQAIQHQQATCMYHNPDDPHPQYVSLLRDHACDIDQIPHACYQVLEKHSDEVWHVQFSHNGKYIASASKDCTVIIWDVTSGEARVHKVLAGHVQSVSFVAWSPDDTMLISCANDNTAKLWDLSGTCLRTYAKHSDAVTCCAWLPDGKTFVTGSLDKTLYMMDIEGNEIKMWSCAKINDMAITSDGSKMIVICQEKKIRIYDLIHKTEDSLQETDAITSVELTRDSRFLLVNLASQVHTNEIHLWDLNKKRLLKKYIGHRQGRFVIRSCFGGPNQNFIISGSEDSQIYIWNRENCTLVEVLSGHTGTVNSVSWSNNGMLASASDDHTVRIWAKPKPGSGHSNGTTDAANGKGLLSSMTNMLGRLGSGVRKFMPKSG